MTIFYHIKTKVLSSKIADSFRIEITQDYVVLFLPIFPMPMKKIIVSDCISGNIIPESEWSVKIRQEAQALKKASKTRIWFFSYLLILVAVFAIVGPYRLIKNRQEAGNEKNIEVHINNPQVGDIVVASLINTKSNTNQTTGCNYTTFKIFAISGDTIIAKRNKDIMHDDGYVLDMDKLKSTLKSDDAAFNDKNEYFILNAFKRNHTLYPYVDPGTEVSEFFDVKNFILEGE